MKQPKATLSFEWSLSYRKIIVWMLCVHRDNNYICIPKANLHYPELEIITEETEAI